MTSRQRVLAALRREPADRAPFNMRLAPDLARRVSDRVGATDLEAHFGYDIRFVSYASDTPAPDVSGWLGELPEGAVVSPWGVATVKGGFMHFARQVHPMREMTAPDLDAYPWPEFEPDLAAMRERVARIHDAGLAAVSGYECGSYEQGCALRGQEAFLMDLAAEPGLAADLLGRIAEIKRRKAMANAEAGVDVVWIGDDLGTQQGLVFSPDTWRQLVRPPLEHIVAGIRSVREDAIIAYHSCGHVEPLVGELADVGIDVLESVQPEANDVAALKREHGHRLAFWGTLGAQSTFSHGTADDVRAEVRNRIQTTGAGGGLMLAPAHVLEPEVPIENVIAFADEARQ